MPMAMATMRMMYLIFIDVLKNITREPAPRFRVYDAVHPVPNGLFFCRAATKRRIFPRI
jgi:hypothetical protein